jgi:Trk K+ transport system NAD-binding subunit
VVLIARGNDLIVPGGGTILEPDDVPLALADTDALAQVQDQIDATG